MMKWMLAVLAALLWVLPGEAADGVFPGRDGHVQAVVLTNLESLPLNRIHTWKVRFEAPDGSSLDGLSVDVTGGMPTHDHGLPTEPVAREKAPGVYRVEGVRFHMHGAWEMIFEVQFEHQDGQSRADTVKVSFEL